MGLAYLFKLSKYQEFIYLRFFLGNDEKPSGTTISLIVTLVLPLKIIIGSKINPSAAAVRTTSHASFRNLKFELL